MTLFLVLAALFIYVLTTNEITKLHKAYLVFHFLMMLWPLFIYLVNITPNLKLEWVFLKIAFFGLSFVGYSWLLFSLFLTDRIDHIKKTTLSLAALPAILCSVMAAVNPYFLFVRINERGWAASRLCGPLFWVFAITELIYVAVAIMLTLWKRQTTEDKMLKKQLNLCLIGSLFFFLFAVADILLNVAISSTTLIPALTSIGTTLSVICFTVAIKIYDLFRIVSIAERKIIDNMCVGIVVLNNDGTIISRNRSANRYIDFQPNRAFDLNQILSLSDNTEFNNRFLRNYKTGDFENLQTEIAMGKEKKLQVLLNVSKIAGDKKESLGRIITLSDITEIHNLLEEIRQKNLVLQQRNDELRRIQEELFQMEKSRRNLLSNISHDLRSPMTHIQGYLKAILDGVINEPEQQIKYLELVYTKAICLKRLIDDLFHLSQLESRQVSYDFCSIPADKLVTKLFYEYELEAESAGMNIGLQVLPYAKALDGNYPMVDVDADRFAQVFTNLISNAIKNAGYGGEITISLEPVWRMAKAAGGSPGEGISSITERPTCEGVLIGVKDNGPGIAEEDIPYIFDRFYKGKGSERPESYGIGLAIAKEIVTIHEGQIWVESKPGQGSTFYIRLPVKQAAQ